MPMNLSVCLCRLIVTLLVVPCCYVGQDIADVNTDLQSAPPTEEANGVRQRCWTESSGRPWDPSDTPEWVVKLKPFVEESYLGISYDRYFDQSELADIASSVAEEFNLEGLGHVSPFYGVFKLRYNLDKDQQLQGLERREMGRVSRRLAEVGQSLDSHPNVLWASRQHCLVRQKRTVRIDFNDPMFGRQWHLVNSKESGHDINVTEVWSNDITGEGVVIAVVDDGLEHTNEDIQHNYNATGSYDFNDSDEDPTPNLSTSVDNTHGTKCAGLISAVANNSHCAVGVAHGASVSGIRMLDGKVTDLLEAQSFIHKAHVNWIFSCSWGPEDSGKTVEGPGRLAQEALELGITKGRYGYGNIFVFASGNGGQMFDNCNFDGYANSIYTLTVGAVDEKNKMPYYAEPCPCMLAVTYSNGHSLGDRNIVTTDSSTHGGCTKSFTGTSAAAPIASGMVALMLQIRNCLTWRDVQSVLVYSAVEVDVAGAEWVENGAGFHHSDQHGFGLMDAYRLAVVARAWPLLPAMGTLKVPRKGRGLSVPANGSSLIVIILVDRNSSGSARDKFPQQLGTLEYVALTITLTHQRRGDLRISLTSPNVTTSILSTPRKYDDATTGLGNWTFTTSRFWGESPTGIWTLNVTDTSTHHRTTKSIGMLSDWTLTLYGSEITPDEVQERRDLVEKALLEGFGVDALSCPPLPPVPDDLTVAFNFKPLHLWEKVVVIVVMVLCGVLVIHGGLQLLKYKYRNCKRQRKLLQSPSNNVRFVRGSIDENSRLEAGSEEESFETSRLIFIQNQETRNEDDGSMERRTEREGVERDVDEDSDALETSRLLLGECSTGTTGSFDGAGEVISETASCEGIGAGGVVGAGILENSTPHFLRGREQQEERKSALELVDLKVYNDTGSATDMGEVGQSACSGGVSDSGGVVVGVGSLMEGRGVGLRGVDGAGFMEVIV